MHPKKIFLITDFGTRDWYVPVMKSKILEINPEAIIIDGTHDLTSFDIQSTSFFVEQISKDVSHPSIFVVVVDPGVGGKMHKRIIIKNKHWFIGPDNGVFSRIITKSSQYWEIDNRKLKKLAPIHTISDTFHGRDIFSPAAGLISIGKDLTEFCNEIKKVFKNKIITPTWKDKKLIGQIVHIDKYGNSISNINKAIFCKYITSKKKVSCTINEQENICLFKTFSQVPEGVLFCLFNSGEFIEVAVNKGNASKIYNIKIGGKIILNIKK